MLRLEKMQAEEDVAQAHRYIEVRSLRAGDTQRMIVFSTPAVNQNARACDQPHRLVVFAGHVKHVQ